MLTTCSARLAIDAADHCCPAIEILLSKKLTKLHKPLKIMNIRYNPQYLALNCRNHSEFEVAGSAG
jgi:hypothetical protein